MYYIILSIIVILFFVILCFMLVRIQRGSEILCNIKIPTQTKNVDLHTTDKIIWSYWDSDTQPLTVQVALYTWYKHNKDYHIIMLNKNNIHKYIDLNTLPKKFNELSVQKQSDVIRLGLLEKYGGIWLDSTIYLNQSLSIEWDNQYDIGGYWAEFFTTDPKHPVFESWFISCPKNSKLIKAWKKEFYKAIDLDHDLYIEELEKKISLQNILAYKLEDRFSLARDKFSNWGSAIRQ